MRPTLNSVIDLGERGLVRNLDLMGYDTARRRRPADDGVARPRHPLSTDIDINLNLVRLPVV